VKIVSSEGDISSRKNETAITGPRKFRFPRMERLKGKDSIREVFNRNLGVSCPGAKLLMLQNGLPYNRIAFTFSRKFGNAIMRNHSRRLSREVYRRLRNQLRTGHDLVLLAYSNMDNFSVRTNQLRDLFSRAGLFYSS